MQEKNGQIELTDDEARLANYQPRFPVSGISQAVGHMRRRQAALQAEAERRFPPAGNEEARIMLSRESFLLGSLIDELEQLR